MSEPKPVELQYGGYEKARPLSRAAVFALIVGILSGPISVFAAFFVGFVDPDFGSKDFMAFIALVACHLFLWLFTMYTARRLAQPDAARGRALAMGGMIATLAWGVAIAMVILLMIRA